MSFLGLMCMLLSAGVAGHSCNDGSRVQCMAVQALGNEQSVGDGKGARGTPHCSEGGDKVYCLVHHNWHGCSNGYQPCCRDGSNPWHQNYREHHEDSSDTLTCSKDAAAAVLSESKEPFAPPDPVILDDMDYQTDIVVAYDGVNAFEGSYQPCMEDSYKQQFHHDWAQNKGSASFTFTFKAPVSGCYNIEEYHPGNNPMCSRYLPQASQLDVHHHAGMQTYYINQAVKNAQWNEVGTHFFSHGVAGELIMRNSKHEKCSATGCFWVADAFRFTWAGKECGQDHAISPPVAPAEAPEVNLMAGNTGGSDRQVEVQGMLKLQVHAGHMDGHAHDHVDVVAQLQTVHKDVLITTLALHFSLDSVDILDVAVAGRRLAGSSAINIQFSGQGNGGALSSSGLSAALQKALPISKTGFAIMEATVEWKTSGADDVQSSSMNSSVFVYAAAAAVLVLLFAVTVCLYKYVMKKKTAGEGELKPAVVGQAVDECTNEKELDDQIAAKKDSWEVDSIASTKSPVSNAAGSDEGRSNEDNQAVEPSSIIIEI